MIPKFKRFFSINTSTEVPNPETCIRLVSITAQRTSELEIFDLQIKHIVCGDEYDEEIINTISSTIIGQETLNINTCIKSNSLYVGGVNITEEGVYNIPHWEISVDFDICIAPEPVVVYSAQRSLSSVSFENTEEACSTLNLELETYIETSVNGEITSGDVVYEDAFGTVKFNGGFNYFALKLNTQLQKRICRISDEGVINVEAICF
jgi:hypothetical protein